MINLEDYTYENLNKQLVEFNKYNPVMYYMYQGTKAYMQYWSSMGIVMGHFLNPLSSVFPY